MVENIDRISFDNVSIMHWVPFSIYLRMGIGNIKKLNIFTKERKTKQK